MKLFARHESNNDGGVSGALWTMWEADARKSAETSREDAAEYYQT
ncbi:hypothetical protein [Bacillus amyloliquefaciens]|nr:hypothetical protein [Bacillus amyloliquefaciens]MEC3841311.1 hypothetical protein [Bacillus amyloliquefaciens]